MQEKDNLKRLSPYSPKNIIRLLRHLPDLANLYVRLLLDPRVPIGTKIVPLLGLIYVLSPFDLIPDYLIPGAGWLDDAIILFFCMRFFGRLAPREIVDEHIKKIERGR
jgi:uncharacterized membrane protein YkvA (DUF1232 family)